MKISRKVHKWFILSTNQIISKLFYTSEPLRAYYGTKLPFVIFFDRPKKNLGAFQTYRTKSQPVKKKNLSVKLIIPNFLLICSDHHQICKVCSLVHNVELFFEILFFINFILVFVFLGLSHFMRWSTHHVQIEFLLVLCGKWPILRLFY